MVCRCLLELLVSSPILFQLAGQPFGNANAYLNRPILVGFFSARKKCPLFRCRGISWLSLESCTYGYWMGLFFLPGP